MKMLSCIKDVSVGQTMSSNILSKVAMMRITYEHERPKLLSHKVCGTNHLAPGAFLRLRAQSWHPRHWGRRLREQSLVLNIPPEQLLKNDIRTVLFVVIGIVEDKSTHQTLSLPTRESETAVANRAFIPIRERFYVLVECTCVYNSLIPYLINIRLVTKATYILLNTAIK